MMNERLKSFIFIVIFSGLIGLSAGLWAKYIATPWFSSNAVVVLNKDYEQNLSSLISALNPFANYGSTSNFSEDAAILEAKLTSRAFLKTMAQETDFLEKIYKDNWDDKKKSWIGKPKDSHDLKNFLNLNFFVSGDVKTFFLDVVVLTEDKALSKEIIEYMLKTLNEKEAKKVKLISEEMIKVAEGEIRQVKNSYDQKVLRDIIQNEKRKYLLAKAQTDFYLTIEDPPELAKFKSKPKGRSYAIFFFSFSFIFISIFYLRREIWRFLEEDLKNFFQK